MKDLWQKIPPQLKNKYILTALAFLIWMFFFDQNDVISQIELRNELYQLKDDKVYYEKQIQSTKEELEELISNEQKLEKFAREKYLMKKDNEEIFIIVDEKEEN